VADNVIYSFYIGAGVLILSILYTIFTTKEYSPKNLQNLKRKREQIRLQIYRYFQRFCKYSFPDEKIGSRSVFSWFALFTMWVFTTSALATHHFGLSPEDTHSAEFNAGDLTGSLFGIIIFIYFYFY
jgi:maltose/moltooligosaccharide transporter